MVSFYCKQSFFLGELCALVRQVNIKQLNYEVQDLGNDAEFIYSHMRLDCQSFGIA